MRSLRKIFYIFILLDFLYQKSVSQSIVTCSCDLTSNACDAGCCCDTDCSADDVAIFQCSNTTVNEDSNLCVNELVFVNNLPSTEVVEDNGLFCIVRQRDTSNNFYTDPVILSDSTDFETTSLQYPTYSYDLSTTSTTTTTSYYTAGDTMDVMCSNGSLGKFSFPVPGVGNACLGANPASFLTDQTSSCRRFVLSPKTCASNTFLDPSYYSSFTISPRPILNTTTATFLNLEFCEAPDPEPDPIKWDNTTRQCLGVAKSISYRITYNGTSGINSACFSFPQIANITTESVLVQTFSISFISLDTVLKNTSSRSGNPGYITGKPLRTAIGSLGSLTFDTSQMTLVSSDTDGTCNSNISAKQVNFREDSRMGCLLSISSKETCGDVLARISALIAIPSNIFVSTYGNTLLNSTIVGDWIEVVESGELPEMSGTDVNEGCVKMLVGVNYNVFYANTGSISNAQPRIIGVQYSNSAKTVAYECYSANCPTQYVEVFTSVTFTDASTSPSAVLKERPTVNARLPSDFFFPFTGNAN